MKYLLKYGWDRNLKETMKRFLFINSSDGYGVTHYENTVQYYSKHRNEPFIIGISIDIFEEYEKEFLNIFLKNVYENLKSSPALFYLKGKILIWNEGKIEKLDLFKYPNIQIKNDEISHFDDILKELKSIYGRPNLFIHLTGKDNSNTIPREFPVIWVFTRNDINAKFGYKIYAFTKQL